MAKGFIGFGICARCGDTQGPWGWHPGTGWLCEDCEEMENEIIVEGENEKTD